MPGEPAQAEFVQVAGARVRFTDSGHGSAVVLIHGFASALETWAPIRPALLAEHRVIALDLKGFGWTDRPAGDYSPAAEAELVWALLDARGVDRVAVVAHSWGSSVALAMALAHPERVTRVALYDAWVYEEQLPAFFLWSRAQGVGEALFALWYDQRPDERMTQAFFDKSLFTEAFTEEVEHALERPGTKAAALAAVRGQHYAEVQDQYRTLHLPALLLWGRDDVVTTVAHGERLSRDLGARLIVYPRCGHFPMFEARHESTDELVRFLKEAP